MGVGACAKVLTNVEMELDGQIVLKAGVGGEPDVHAAGSGNSKSWTVDGRGAWGSSTSWSRTNWDGTAWGGTSWGSTSWCGTSWSSTWSRVNPELEERELQKNAAADLGSWQHPIQSAIAESQVKVDQVGLAGEEARLEDVVCETCISMAHRSSEHSKDGVFAALDDTSETPSTAKGLAQGAEQGEEAGTEAWEGAADGHAEEGKRESVTAAARRRFQEREAAEVERQSQRDEKDNGVQKDWHQKWLKRQEHKSRKVVVIESLPGVPSCTDTTVDMEAAKAPSTSLTAASAAGADENLQEEWYQRWLQRQALQRNTMVEIGLDAGTYTAEQLQVVQADTVRSFGSMDSSENQRSQASPIDLDPLWYQKWLLRARRERKPPPREMQHVAGW